MIFSTLSQVDRYAALHPLFPRAFDYIRNTDLFALAPGRYNIVGDDLIAIVEHLPGKTREMAKLEAHRRYIDIQLVLDGMEEMGWKPLADCHNPVSEHSMEKDIRFFHDAAASWIAVPPEHFCIFFPEDAHAPLVAKGSCDTLLEKPLATRLGEPTALAKSLVMAKPADRGSNCQATPPAPEGFAPPRQGGYIRKVIFKIAVNPEQP
jgi:biofilm protein TabA